MSWWLAVLDLMEPAWVMEANTLGLTSKYDIVRPSIQITHVPYKGDDKGRA